MAASDDVLDCLIIGAGPAGLTAATYLTRFHRCVAVVDAGTSRARWIPTSHNCPGFPLGVAGTQLLQKLREQAEGYGAKIESNRITGLQRDSEHFVANDDGGAQWRARFLRTFSRQVSVLRSEPGEPSDGCASLAGRARIAVLPVPRTLRFDPESGCTAGFAEGDERSFDTVYPVLGGDAQSQLATALGAQVDDDGELIVDSHLQTTVDGLYAIGDVVNALNQISVAVGHAALAATAIHNRLPRNFREDEASQPDTAAALPGP
ncbi:MAG: NAD(P)/FAD-dependent oxidoreductase [Gammaproteobacteria bacterium]|nr:NAD(P)/FAD-dependent oxidoreductase [Gammaproteobacteria bacterium]